jgi:proteasome lid subunit RPN8/RPN11
MGDWLLGAAEAYNLESYEQREMYATHLLIPIETMRTVIRWSMESIPDEVLIGFDPDPERPNPKMVEEVFGPAQSTFSGYGYLLGVPHIVNVGDSYSVHHVPEEWTDGVFSEERGARGSRFASFLHSHPNAYAHPSEADAEAADWTEGVEMILGVRFSPAPLGLEWYDEEESHRRDLNPENEGELPVLARVAGRKVHGFELIGYLRNGEGVNLLITEDEGFPIGLEIYMED